MQNFKNTTDALGKYKAIAGNKAEDRYGGCKEQAELEKKKIELAAVKDEKDAPHR